MLTQIYYCSMTQNELDHMNIKQGDILEIISAPTRGSFLKSLTIHDEVLITLSANVTMNKPTDNSKDIVVLSNARVDCIQVLSSLTINEVLSLYNEDPTGSNGIVLDWAFEQGFKSVLIHYLDKYPELRKHIGRIIYAHISNHSKVWLMKTLIDRYDYDITANDNRLITQAAMNKNDTLCEYLLKEKDARIPENVFNVFMNFGTKRFQHMWDLLKRYKSRVISS